MFIINGRKILVGRINGAWTTLDTSRSRFSSVGLEYYLYRNEYRVTGIGTCTDIDLIIPPTYEGKAVTNIGPGAFSGCTSLTSITVPDSIKQISDNAFTNCSGLTGVYITDIKAWCNITFSVVCANPLEFAKNLYLNGELVTDLVIPYGPTKLSRTFINCTNLTSVVIPDSVTWINNYSFSGCTRLKSVTIPNSVKTISADAFANSGLKSVVIPKSVTEISDAFEYCKRLETIIFEEGIQLTEIRNYAFWNCWSLNNVVIPDGVTRIGDAAFRECSRLTNLTIPSSVTSIGESAFYLTKLTDIYYKGTRAQWQAITFDDAWNPSNVGCVVHCIDDDIPESTLSALDSSSLSELDDKKLSEL